MDDDDGGQDFTADVVPEPTGETGQLILDGTNATNADAGDNIIFEEGTINAGTIRCF